MLSLKIILLAILNICWWIVLIQLIMSWLIQFDVINIRQRLVYQIWSGLNRITEPVYSRIRQFVPSMGGLDFTPLIAFLGIFALQVIVQNNL